jgi:anaerobic selenocysteine-containing dehydrogenase
MKRARCTFEELKEKRYVEFPLELPAQWAENHFERIGGWKLAPEVMLEQWFDLRDADEAELGKPKPLVLTSRRQVKKLNAQLSFMGEIADLFVHPDTAAAHGITDGQQVRVSTKRGEITVTAKVDPGMRKGVCSIPHGHLHANVNNLTNVDDVDRYGGMALYSGVPIEIEPLV